MKIVEGSKLIYFDVDDTLVMWDTYGEQDSLVEFSNPDDSSFKWYLKPNIGTIEMLKQHKREGYTVVVWSQGGWDWVQEVVKTLKLEEYVDLCITKPNIYVDDLHCEKWMTNWRKI